MTRDDDPRENDDTTIIAGGQQAWSTAGPQGAEQPPLAGNPPPDEFAGPPQGQAGGADQPGEQNPNDWDEREYIRRQWDSPERGGRNWDGQEWVDGDQTEQVIDAADPDAPAVIAPPGSGPVDGRSGIEAYWKNDIGAGGEVTKLTASGSMAAGDLLHVNGAYEVTSTNGMPLAKGQYEQLWKHDNGQWKVQEEMWRIDPTAQHDPLMAEQFESQWTTAYNAGDAKALAALYDKDAVLSTRPMGSFEGKDAIEVFWKEDFGTGKPTTKLKMTDAYLAGEMAHLEGEYQVTDRGKVTTGHYVQLWMQDGDDWRIHREVWWQ